MAMTGQRGSYRKELMALACALAVASCAPATGNHEVAATFDKSAVRLTPDPAFASARIAVVFAENGPSRANCSYEWRRNGAIIQDASTSVLEASQFSKGDRISVHVSIPATGADPQTLSAQVKVANSPPLIHSVQLVMVVEPGGPEVQAKVECADPDGDTPTFEYEWSRNGDPIKGAKGSSVPVSELGRGDHVTVEVVARDDEAASPAVSSAPFTMENHAPAFTSQPGAPKDGDTLFRYQAAAADPDGDPLRYVLVKGPAGMSVNERGELLWVLPSGESRGGDYVVTLRAADPNGGEAVQEFTIRLGTPHPSH